MSKSILYIEDNADNRLLVRRILEAEGYRMLEAPDGETGIEMAQTDLPDLILMDINLPDLDGYEATRRLRKLPALDNVPILALTANALKGDREKSLEAGCNNYIRKPIDVDSFPQQISEYL